MSKQTAVQLLRESIDSEMKLGTKMVVNWDMYLAMEKEQIQAAYKDGLIWHPNDFLDQKQYYDEIYGGDK